GWAACSFPERAATPRPPIACRNCRRSQAAASVVMALGFLGDVVRPPSTILNLYQSGDPPASRESVEAARAAWFRHRGLAGGVGEKGFQSVEKLGIGGRPVLVAIQSHEPLRTARGGEQTLPVAERDDGVGRAVGDQYRALNERHLPLIVHPIVDQVTRR